MEDAAKVIHVTFGPSRAESVRDALRMQGCDERIIALSSVLNYGPIDPPDSDVRHTWIRTVLRCDPQFDRREPEAPWTEATSASVYPVYWVCMSDAAEQASFLEFAFRMAGRPFDIIDATGLDFITADGVRWPWSLGIMRPEDIVKSGLKERRRSISHNESEVASAAWLRLRQENAPLRIVQDGCLVSAPLTYFDKHLIAQAASEWEVVARLIGRTMHHLSYDLDPPGQSPSDVVLFGRVLALGDEGLLDIIGSGLGMRDYKVRVPASKGPS